MKLLLYTVVLAIVLLLPAKGTDVGKLIPVEVIAVSEDRDTITVMTDTCNVGKGNTLEAAFDNLKETASGVIYLDTAEYLLLEPGTEDQIQKLRETLKGNLKVANAPEEIALEGAAKYLSAHRPQTKLNDMEEERIPILSEEDGRYQLTEK